MFSGMKLGFASAVLAVASVGMMAAAPLTTSGPSSLAELKHTHPASGVAVTHKRHTLHARGKHASRLSHRSHRLSAKGHKLHSLSSKKHLKATSRRHHPVA